MKILCAINHPLPQIAAAVNVKTIYGGKWVLSMVENFIDNDKVKFVIACPGKVQEVIHIHQDEMDYWVYPNTKKLKINGGGKFGIKLWDQIIKEANPDLVYVFGTEYGYPLELIKEFNHLPILLSIQGVMSGAVEKEYGGLKIRDVFLNITLADVLLGRSLFHEKRMYSNKARLEKEILSRIKYAECRTSYDKAVVKSINKNIFLYNCYRFVNNKYLEDTGWEITKSEPHTVFCSQTKSVLKGFHYLLDAIFILKQTYPDIKLIVAGNNILDRSTLRKKLLSSGYSKFVTRKIKVLKLDSCIEYTGYLGTEALISYMKKSRVYVLPTLWENSSNSLTEAMLVGIPCVASCVGGNSDILFDNKVGLVYPHNEPLLLADRISRIFESDEMAILMSHNERILARNRHDPSVLKANLINIFESIVGNHVY